MSRLVFLLFIFFAFLTNSFTCISATDHDPLHHHQDFSGEKATHQTFIIRTQNHLKPSVFSSSEQWYSSIVKSLTSPLTSSSNQLESNGFSDENAFLHVYNNVFHGFSIRLSSDHALQLQNHPAVLAVLPDRLRQIQTTRSPLFLGLETVKTFPLNNSFLSQSDGGSNVIIGVFDTGISPERRSFSDDGLGPIPSHWKGECVEGEKFNSAHCNRKIIGARFFTAGYDSSIGRTNSTRNIKSARDSDGHGTHTASTAAGRAVENASFFGLAKGVAVGIAPKARIAVYKVCWKRGCMDSDILAAFDKAVEDGVDIISLSVGGRSSMPYNLDPIAIGSFGAMERGTFVAAAAGNEGPSKNTITNIAPWITTVGAGTIDRRFPADLVLEDGRIINGASLYNGSPLPPKSFYNLIYAGNASIDLSHGARVRRAASFSAAVCMPNSLDPELVRGKIVLCERGIIPRVNKGEAVKQAGGIGLIIANVAPLGEGIVADAHLIPGLAVGESAGRLLRNYIGSAGQNARATMVFYGTQIGVKPAPVVASFSSRGPSLETPYVLKPDIIAPGVNILAAWPDRVPPTELSYDTRQTEFNIISGTSMSCPHISGVAALLKGAHPDWSPAMIRSALMTTAYVLDLEGLPLRDEKSENSSSTAWDMGAGHVNPKEAMDPGLVYDLTVDDYLEFLCASNYSIQSIKQISQNHSTTAAPCKRKQNKSWDLNYPAIAVAIRDNFASSTSKDTILINARRIVTHVSDSASSYNVRVVNPRGAVVRVVPSRLDFKAKGEKKRYLVEIQAEKMEVRAGNFVSEAGRIIWSDGKHQVVSPVVVLWEKRF